MRTVGQISLVVCDVSLIVCKLFGVIIVLTASCSAANGSFNANVGKVDGKDTKQIEKNVSPNDELMLRVRF